MNCLETLFQKQEKQNELGMRHLFDEHAEREVELVGPQLEDVSLEGLLVFALGPLLLQLSVLAHHPVLPCVHLHKAAEVKLFAEKKLIHTQ